MLNKNIFRLCRHLILQTHSRSYHRKEFKIKSDFFDNHPINRQTIDELEKIDLVRKNRGSIEIVRSLFSEFENEADTKRKEELQTELRNEFKKFPNQTHPTVLSYGPNAGNTEIKSHGNLEKTTNPNGKDYETLCNLLKAVRLEQLGNFTGTRSYYLMQSIAELVSIKKTSCLIIHKLTLCASNCSFLGTSFNSLHN